MDELLNVLEQLYEEGENEIRECDGDLAFEDSELFPKVQGLCEELLITSNCRCNWDNIQILRNHGYRVFAGEKDSFGWLIGCVQKIGDPRIIYYG